MSKQEVCQQVILFKQKINLHYATRQSHQVNESYINYLEEKLAELSKLIDNKSNVKKKGVNSYGRVG